MPERPPMKNRPQTSLWEVVFWWVPDLTDEEGGKANRGRSKRSGADRISRGLRNRPLLEKLMKPRDNKLKDRRRKNKKDDSEEADGKQKLKEKKSCFKSTEEDNVKEEVTSMKSKSQMKNKEKTNVHQV
ncbi:hypothetical protein NHX12_003671 [Muraenolepis orangiensis]|uniref:Uncharacterized protein n=1 Tax=Muraenolepis orangiensis TaxID=630683 RepID=A0A9Q0DRI5_9TELE|nr:hypothetical protein NHX12_003671 [Muraenolepis orangiensis]